MAEDKILKRKKEIINLTDNFCRKYLDSEFSNLCEELVEDLYNLDEVPFKRGKLEIWASAIIHKIASVNMLFYTGTVPHIQVKDITNYFKTKEPTLYSKSKTIGNFFDEDEFIEKYCIMVFTSSDNVVLKEADGSLTRVNVDFNKNLDDVDLFFIAVSSVANGGDSEKALEMLNTVPITSEEYPRALVEKAYIYMEEDVDKLNDVLEELNRDYPEALDKYTNNPDPIDEYEDFENPTGGYLVEIQLYAVTMVWRELKIPNNITFKQLHNLIQKLFNFHNYHMWDFSIPKKIDGETVDLNQPVRTISPDEADKLKISEIFNDSMVVLYRYDFGDNWEITIIKRDEIEYTSKSAEITNYDGKYSPMDDIGGPDIFDEIMECDDEEEMEYVLDEYGMDLSHLEEMDFEKKFKIGSKIKL